MLPHVWMFVFGSKIMSCKILFAPPFLYVFGGPMVLLLGAFFICFFALDYHSSKRLGSFGRPLSGLFYESKRH